MAEGEPLNHAQQYEQAIATVIACRTLIKYDTPLGEKQKDEIVAELDTALQFLQKRLITNSAIDAYTEIPPLQTEMLAELMASQFEEDEKDDLSEGDHTAEELYSEKQQTPELLMHNLYKLYHTYLSSEPGKGIQALETRYKIAIKMLDEVRSSVRIHQQSSSGEKNELLLFQVQEFISLLYCMFHEFSAILAGILENKKIMIETEELTSLQKYASEQKRHIVLRDVSPLLRVYGSFLQFQQRRGRVTQLVSDVMAFFIFLEQKLGTKDIRKREMVEQLRNVSDLLHEISSLLVEYEQAFSATLAT